MAERRMFSRRLLTSDSFSELPIVSRMLYINMNLEADDEGFVGNAKKIMRNSGAKMNHISSLIDANFLIKFDSGVYAITHWHTHNKISGARLTNTQYIREKAALKRNRCGEYVRVMSDDEIDRLMLENECDFDEEDSKEKERKEEKRKGKNSSDKLSEAKPNRALANEHLTELEDAINQRRTELGVLQK